MPPIKAKKAVTKSIKSSRTTDRGGVAARIGFKFQDHCAVSFLVEMLVGDVIEVLCETSDDIQIVHDIAGEKINEYIQAKTTSGTKSWNMTELCKIGGSSTYSLYSNSLSFDNNTNDCRFRIISTREIDRTLSYLKIQPSNRNDTAIRDKLIRGITRLSKKNVSPNNNGAAYWIDNVIWEVYPSIEALEALNQNKLFKLFDSYGTSVTHKFLQKSYEELLSIVDKAASASKKDKTKKTITKQFITDWWSSKIKGADSINQENIKPYKQIVEPFLVEFHSLTEDNIKRGLSGLDVGYERKKWRTNQFIEHLKEWFLEITLKASELSKFNYTNGNALYKRAIEAIKDRVDIVGAEIISDILLHIAIRQTYNSDPIACKIFYQTAKGAKCFPNAHIVNTNSKTELWLGKSILGNSKDFNECSKLILETLSEHLDTEFLKKEREIIINLSEPQHLMPNNLQQILHKNTSVDRLLECLCIPILIAYDSQSLSQGFIEDYKEKLSVEVGAHYEEVKKKMSVELTDLRIHVFLIPIENTKILIQQFENSLS